MERLTRKLTQKDIDEQEAYYKGHGLNVIIHPKVGDYTIDRLALDNSPMEKLGKFEDIEEELGVDLIKLLTAQEIYVMDYGKPYESWSPTINLKTKKVYTIDETTRNICGEYDFSDYGTTWALTKEELEK